MPDGYCSERKRGHPSYLEIEGDRHWGPRLGPLRRATLEEPSASLTALTLTADGKNLVTGTAAGKLIVWDAVTGKNRQIPGGYQGEITAVALSPDGNLLATASQDKTIMLWPVSDVIGGGPNP